MVEARITNPDLMAKLQASKASPDLVAKIMKLPPSAWQVLGADQSKFDQVVRIAGMKEKPTRGMFGRVMDSFVGAFKSALFGAATSGGLGFVVHKGFQKWNPEGIGAAPTKAMKDKAESDVLAATTKALEAEALKGGKASLTDGDKAAIAERAKEQVKNIDTTPKIDGDQVVMDYTTKYGIMGGIVGFITGIVNGWKQGGMQAEEEAMVWQIMNSGSAAQAPQAPAGRPAAFSPTPGIPMGAGGPGQGLRI